jgi:outer membrane protein assembly factor BamA
VGVRALLLCVFVVAGAAWAVIRHLPATEAQAESFPLAGPQEIRSVAFDGVGLPLAALRDRLSTRVGQAIDLAMLARDREALEETLVARGYLDARVGDPRVTFTLSGAFVTFAVTQGPLFRIRNVAIKGASEGDAGLVVLGGGEVADAARIALVRQALEQRLAARGKRSVVAATLAPDVSAAVVDVELRASH